MSNSNLSLQYFCDETKHDSDKTEYFRHDLRVSQHFRTDVAKPLILSQ